MVEQIKIICFSVVNAHSTCRVNLTRLWGVCDTNVKCGSWASRCFKLDAGARSTHLSVRLGTSNSDLTYPRPLITPKYKCPCNKARWRNPGGNPFPTLDNPQTAVCPRESRYTIIRYLGFGVKVIIVHILDKYKAIGYLDPYGAQCLHL